MYSRFLMNSGSRLLFASTALAFLGMAASANTVVPAPLGAGSRTEGAGEITTIGNWPTDGRDFTVAWNITQVGDDYTYVYTVSGYRQPGLSHFSIATSDGENDTIIFTEDNVLPGSDGDIEVGNLNEGGFGAPSDFYGLKFDFGDDDTTTYTLVTDRAPIWGSFFAKGGSASGAYNVGFQPNQPLAFAGPNFDAIDFIPVPDSVGVIPEPASMAMVGIAALAGLGLAMKRRSK